MKKKIFLFVFLIILSCSLSIPNETHAIPGDCQSFTVTPSIPSPPSTVFEIKGTGCGTIYDTAVTNTWSILICKEEDVDCEDPVTGYQDTNPNENLVITLSQSGLTLSPGTYYAALIYQGSGIATAFFTINDEAPTEIICGTKGLSPSFTGCPSECAAVPDPSSPPSWWCPCGQNEGQICCPVPPYSEKCPGDPGVSSVLGEMVCLVEINRCARQIDALCGSVGFKQTYINTALGCVPFDTSENFTGFILARFTALTGGVTVLLFSAGSIQIVLSRGDKEKLISGQKLISSSIAGLIMFIFSAFINSNLISILEILPK